MKTRSNMPLFVVVCDNVKTLSNSQIDALRCGDYLVKKDASGEHAYKVTYKSDTGMCITYHDASVIETQSYDKVDGNWVYNSEDKIDLTNISGGGKKHLYIYYISDESVNGKSFSWLIFTDNDFDDYVNKTLTTAMADDIRIKLNTEYGNYEPYSISGQSSPSSSGVKDELQIVYEMTLDNSTSVSSVFGTIYYEANKFAINGSAIEITRSTSNTAFQRAKFVNGRIRKYY